MSGERKALIVAVDQYEQEGLRDLLAPAADAEALAQVLGDAQIGGFAVAVVRNEPSHVIQAQIDDLFSESRPDDVLLLHFSCHGLKSDSGELFFAAANTRPNRLSSTAVSADFVQRCMRASRSRSIVLLLDCCYGGAFAQGVTVRAAGDVNVLDSFPKERGGGRGRAVITASTAMEYAFEGEQLTDDQHRRPSLFTNALTEGLATGDADRDEDGWVSLNELYEYVFDKVRERNPHQTPSRQVEMEGDLYLARSRRRRIQPAPLPADLQAAMTDSNMYTRLGAVSELQARLTGDNLAAAAGAFEALEALRNDVRYIAGPAVVALTEATVRPDPTEVRFGAIEQGSPPPRQRVQLLGPPIARACTLRPSHDWIRVYETADGFDVSFDTGRPGRRQGSMAFEMPPRWPTTIVHLLNSVFFVVLSLVFVRLHGTYYDPSNGPSGLFEVTLLGGTIAYGIVALCCGLTIRRTERDRDENIVSIIGLVTVGLIVIGAALITVSAFRAPVTISQIGTAVLLAAALASLLTAAVLLARYRPGTSASG